MGKQRATGRRLPYAIEVLFAAVIGLAVGLLTGVGLRNAALVALGFAVFDLLIGVGIIWRRDDTSQHDFPPQRPD